MEQNTQNYGVVVQPELQFHTKHSFGFSTEDNKCCKLVEGLLPDDEFEAFKQFMLGLPHTDRAIVLNRLAWSATKEDIVREARKALLHFKQERAVIRDTPLVIAWEAEGEPDLRNPYLEDMVMAERAAEYGDDTVSSQDSCGSAEPEQGESTSGDDEESSQESCACDEPEQVESASGEDDGWHAVLTSLFSLEHMYNRIAKATGTYGSGCMHLSPDQLVALARHIDGLLAERDKAMEVGMARDFLHAGPHKAVAVAVLRVLNGLYSNKGMAYTAEKLDVMCRDYKWSRKLDDERLAESRRLHNILFHRGVAAAGNCRVIQTLRRLLAEEDVLPDAVRVRFMDYLRADYIL